MRDKVDIGYPLILYGEGERCLVAGGGKIAEQRVFGLPNAPADLVVAIPSLPSRLQPRVVTAKLGWIWRGQRRSDLDDAALLIAGMSGKAVTQPVCRDADEQHLLGSATSERRGEGFIMPATIRRVLVGGSSAGGVSALTRRLKLQRDSFLRAFFSPPAQMSGQHGSRLFEMAISPALQERNS